MIPKELVLDNLDDFNKNGAPDVIVEVAHPSITRKYAKVFLAESEYYMGSPTAIADLEMEQLLRESAVVHGVHVPVGALYVWIVVDEYACLL